MLKHTILAAALILAPMVISPASISAQERGKDRAAVALANAAANGRPTALPPGMANLPEGRQLPAGILMTRDVPSDEPAPEEPATEPAPEEPATDPNCMPEIVNGELVPCEG